MSDLCTPKTLAHALGMNVDGKAFRSALRDDIDKGVYATFNAAHPETPITRVGSGKTYGYTDDQAVAILKRMRDRKASAAGKRGEPVDTDKAASLIAAIEDGLLDDPDAIDEGDAE